MKKEIILYCLLSFYLFARELPIAFEGNNFIKESELYNAIGLEKPYFYEFWKKTPVLDTKSINLAVKRLKFFYKVKGFYHAFITVKVDKKYIKFIIKKGKPVIINSISVISKFDLSPYIPFKKGDIFRVDSFKKSKQEIKNFYKNKGYCKVDLDAKAWIDIDKNRAYLAYDVRANPLCHFGNIKIIKPKDIDSKIIQSFLSFKKGDLYSLRRIKESYDNLYAQSGISNVLITTNMQEGFDVNTTVKVDETKKPMRFQSGLGINSDKGLEISLRVGHKNFYGDLKTVTFGIKHNRFKDSIASAINIPLQDKRSTGSTLEFSNEDFLGYKEKKISPTIYLKQRSGKTITKETLLINYSKISGSNDLATYKNGDFFILSPKFSWIYDSRDDPLEPTMGHFLKVEIEASIKSIISDASYYKYTLEAAKIFPLQSSVIALKVNYNSLHTIDGNLPASYRFYAGGMESNRAYNYRKLGPANRAGDPIGLNSTLGITTEYRFKIYDNIGGVLFNDNTFIGLKEVPDFDKIYSCIGFGFRYKTPIGPIALDFGFDAKRPLKQYAIHFRIGELF